MRMRIATFRHELATGKARGFASQRGGLGLRYQKRGLKERSVLDPTRPHWAAAGVAPERDWSGMPGCRRGARFLIDSRLRPGRSDFPAFETRAACLRWIMEHRCALARNAPGAVVVPVELTHWMLGLA